MSEGFHRRRGGDVIATFTGFEADLLRSLAAQLVELLRNEAAGGGRSRDPLEDILDFSGSTTAPDDPVLARLFPNAYRDDDEAAGEFRRFTEAGLRDGKANGAAAIIGALEEAGLPEQVSDPTLSIDVELDRAGALDWMKSLTDIRLALATRLGIETDEDNERVVPEDDPRSQVLGIYHWLGYLQETLVQAIHR